MPVPEACGAVWEEEEEAEDEAAEDEAAEDRDKTNHSLTTPDCPPFLFAGIPSEGSVRQIE